jgi:6-phosphogluconolactonase
MAGCAGVEKPSADAGPEGKMMTLYVGTYTGPKSKGIYKLTMDPQTGALSKPELAGEMKDPSFLAIAPDGKHLYAIGEVNEFKGKKAGEVAAFAIDPASGMLKLLNEQSAGGPGPCFIIVDPSGRNALIANYGGGSVECVPIKPDGSLAEPSTFIQHTGSSADPGRQKEPHAHSIYPSPDNRYAIACDLGLDKLLIYKFDAAKGTLTPNDPAFGRVAPGQGPRHLSFHPNGKWVYNCNEMGLTACAFNWDAAKGSLTEFQSIDTLAEGASRKGASTAEVAVHPSGKFLYVSNRGNNTIAIFTIDPANGKLTAAGHVPSGGKNPRDFRIDPAGKFLLAANQDSNNIVVFKIDPETGGLTPTGSIAEVGAPVCVQFVK